MTDLNVAQAAAEARRAKADLDATVNALQQRLKPKRLARRAASEAKSKGEDAAIATLDLLGKHPRKVAAGISAALLILARRPLRRLFRRRNTPAGATPQIPINEGPQA